MSAGGRLWDGVEYVAAFVALAMLAACTLGTCSCARTLEYCEDGCAGAAGSAAEDASGAGGAE